MRVKIGNIWHDPMDGPICVELNPTDKQIILGMGEASVSQYVQFDDKKFGNNQTLRDWMADKINL